MFIHLKSLGMQVPGGSNPSPSTGQRRFLGRSSGSLSVHILVHKCAEHVQPVSIIVARCLRNGLVQCYHVDAHLHLHGPAAVANRKLGEPIGIPTAPNTGLARSRRSTESTAGQPYLAATPALGHDLRVTLGSGVGKSVSPGFAERLLEVIDSGRRTATYKLAVLLALLDLCTRQSDVDGHAPKQLSTRDIAERVAALYWPQVAPFAVRGLPTAIDLRQITTSRSAIIDAVREFRREAGGAGAHSFHLARLRLPQEFAGMLRKVENTVVREPLARLQTVGSSDRSFPFIYEFLGAGRAVRAQLSSCRAPATSW